jgi:hypothetical protein
MEKESAVDLRERFAPWLGAAAGAPLRPLAPCGPLPARVDLTAMHPASRSARL